MLLDKIRIEKRSTAIGGYWTSAAAKDRLLESLRSHRVADFKFAAVGGEPTEGFEQAFSSLAYAYLKDKAPRLIDFIVGFQLVDRNEDNTKAVGMFGFKVGDQWMYAPTFFLNGNLKGHELLYIKKQDMFVPMKENWVNYLISKKPHMLGEGSPLDTHQLGGLQPSLSSIARRGAHSKFGEALEKAAEAYNARKTAAESSFRARPADDEGDAAHCRCGKHACKKCKGCGEKAGSDRYQAWARPAVPAIMSLFLKTAAALYPEVSPKGDLDFARVVAEPFKAAFAHAAHRFDMREVLTTPGRLKAAAAAYNSYPLVKKGFDDFYGPGFLDGLAEKVGRCVLSRVKKKKPAGSRKSAAAGLFSPEQSADYRVWAIALDGLSDRFVRIKSAADVDETVEGTIKKNKNELTDAERARLLAEKLRVDDRRERASVAYDTQTSIELANPDQTGLFDMLEKPGTTEEMLVLVNPVSGRGSNNFCVVVRKGDTRAWKNIDRSDIYARQNRQPTDTDFRDYVAGLPGKDSLRAGGTYACLSETGESTVPFRVHENLGDGLYRVEWYDSPPYAHEFKDYRDRFDFYGDDHRPWDSLLRFNARKGGKLRLSGGEVNVPDTFKVLTLRKAKPDPDDEASHEDAMASCLPCGDSADGSEERPIQPGNLLDVQLFVQKSAELVELAHNGTEYVLTAGGGTPVRLDKTACVLELVMGRGLREKQARALMADAEYSARLGKRASCRVKYAYGYPVLRGGPSGPGFPEPEYGTEPTSGGGVTTQYPFEEYAGVEGMNDGAADPSDYDPFYAPDPMAMQSAQMAAQSGQKEVFDAAMFGGMLKSVSQDSMIDNNIGDLLKAMDKLGRLLMMFYWHQEEFEERYGKQDLPELEDSLRNTFEAVGDVSLFLQEKTVQGMNALSMSPDVDTAARI